MTLTDKDIKKVAKLARIGLEEDDIERFKIDLSRILDLARKLDEVDTSNVEPLYSVSNSKLYLRPDIVKSENNVIDVISNAKISEFNCFMVPKVIE